MNEYLMQIGDNVKCRRLDLSLIQKELESRSGVTQSMISKIENGTAENVSIEVLRKLARALNCSLVDLLPEADKNVSNKASINTEEQ
jgi:transcriptional regulator with XRE-family HTH domain